MHKGGPLPLNTLILSPTMLLIEGVTLDNNGYYECNGRYGKNDERFTARADLVVFGKSLHPVEIIQEMIITKSEYQILL